MNKTHVGSTLDDFLEEEGILAECEAGALKRVVAWQLQREMKRRRITRATLANRMKAERSAVNQLFSRNDSPVSLQFLERAALALGRRLKVELA